MKHQGTKISIILAFCFVLGFFADANAQNMSTGMLFDDEAYQNTQQKAVLTRNLYANIPAQYSLKEYAPEVKSQGNFGTCVGWASAYGAFSIADSYNAGRTDRAKIDTEAFSPGFVYTQIKYSSDANCTVGAHIHNALEIMKTKGAAKYSALSEVNCPTSISPAVFSQAENYKIENYAKIFSLYDNKDFKVTATKKSLSQNKPVIIGMNVPNSFFTATNVWAPTESAQQNYYGHAMCVVGYDDNKEGGVFEIMNSWGKQWGNQGFIYITYSDYAKFVKYAFELTAKSAQQKKTNSLAGSIRLQNSEGKTISVKREGNIYNTTESIATGSLFRIYIKNTQPAYVYTFGYDNTEKVFPIFPHNDKTSPYLSYNNNEVAIPDENHFIQTDQTEGTNYLCVLLSAKPIDLQALYTKIETGQGDFNQRINNALRDELMPASALSYKSNEAELSAESKTQSAALIIIKAKHEKK